MKLVNYEKYSDGTHYLWYEVRHWYELWFPKRIEMYEYNPHNNGGWTREGLYSINNAKLIARLNDDLLNCLQSGWKFRFRNKPERNAWVHVSSK